MELKTVLSTLELKHFRLFDHKYFDMNAPLVCIEGQNGSGKTSIIEAISFLGNMRSCKTVFVEHIIRHEQSAFFLKGNLTTLDTVYVGVQQKRKIVRVNQKQISSLSELHSYVTSITLMDKDIGIVQEGPAERRHFLDSLLLLKEPNVALDFKKLAYVVKQRNELLQARYHDQTLLGILSEQLVTVSATIQKKRAVLLIELQHWINHFIKIMELSIDTITLSYVPKVDCTLSLETIAVKLHSLEVRYGKSLYGAQLDDFTIQLGTQNSRIHCSRGQQKLIVLLLKISFLHILKDHYSTTIFLIDDFITDLDQQVIEKIAPVLCSLPVQLICTCPIKGFLGNIFAGKVSQIKTITL